MVELISLPIPLVSSVVEGFPRGGLIVLAGYPGIGKSVFINTTLANALGEGFGCVYVAIDSSVEEIIDDLSERGVDVDSLLSSNRLRFIDGFSIELHAIVRTLSYTRVSILKPVETLDTLYNSLETLDADKKLLVIDSLNEFLMRNEPGIAIDFVKGLKLIGRKTGCISLVTLHLGIPGLEQLYSSIEYLSDGYIEMSFDPRLEELGIPLRRLRVKKMRSASHELQWIPYTIAKGGRIEVVDIKQIISSVRASLAELKSLSLD